MLLFDLTVDEDGNVYVGYNPSASNNLVKLNSSGILQYDVQVNGGNGRGLATNGTNLVSNYQNNEISSIDPSNVSVIWNITAAGTNNT